MKVTVCQLDPRAGYLDASIEGLREHVAEHQSDFVLVPEMSFSEWVAADPVSDTAVWDRAVAAHERYIGALDQLGPKAVLGTRPIVNAQGSRRNEAYLWAVDAPSPAPIHQKYYVPDEEGYWEHSWYDRGPKSFDTARALGARIGVQICTEMWFFEWARHYAASRVDLLCVPRATPHESVQKWLAGGQAAAVCSGAYCLSSNLWMPPGEGVSIGGLGWIIDPEGNVLATTDTEAPYATVEIDLNFSRESKSTYPRYVSE